MTAEPEWLTKWRAYVDPETGISSEEWAISKELCAWIVDRCGGANKPDRYDTLTACDIGSGFSSWLLRDLGYPTVSCDNIRGWATKTEEYLANCFDEWGDEVQYAPYVWCDFETYFDLILYDLGPDADGVSRRAEYLPAVLDRRAPGGVVICDDIHRDVYRMAVIAECAKRGLKFTSLEKETKDRFGRYAGLVSE